MPSKVPSDTRPPYKQVTLRLVTIIAEPLLEADLVQMVRDQGAKGYSLSRVEGEGMREQRLGALEGPNIRLETLVAPTVADRIMAKLQDEFFPRYALIAYLLDAQVVRGEKYI
jgi:nitrogen regulatory protein P-II 2